MSQENQTARSAGGGAGTGQVDRRDALRGLLAISAAGALAACGNGVKADANADAGAAPDVALTYASDGAFFTPAEMAFLAAVSQTIVPQTDTAGAVEAGVPETLQGLASEWGDDGFRRYWRDGLKNLSGKLGSGQSFEEMSEAQRENVLSNYDADVFGAGPDDAFYRDLKSTVLQAYYMSEPGATEELAYEAVPGEWVGCVPVSDYPKTWAT